MSLPDDTTPEEAGPSLLDTALAFFREENWPVTTVPSAPYLHAGFHGTNGQWLCLAHAHEAEGVLAFYSSCPVVIPEGKRAAVAEFLTRANYGILIGNFEFDLETGELRYKSSIDVQGETLTVTLVRSLVYANLAMMDQYLPGIMAVVFGNIAPLDAIRQIEG